MRAVSSLTTAWAVLLLGCTMAWAQSSPVPLQIPYVGQLGYDNGIPYQGAVTVTVALFPTADEPVPVWGPETHAGVEVSDGVLAFALGSVVPLTAAALDGAQLQFGTIEGVANCTTTENPGSATANAYVR